MKIYHLHRASVWHTLGLALFSFFGVYLPIAHWLKGKPVQWEIAWMYPMLAFFWYMHLKPSRSAELTAAGELTFITGFGRRTIAVRDVRSVRPFVNLSRNDFVLHHTRGYELLFENLDATARLIADVLALNPDVKVRGVPPVSG